MAEFVLRAFSQAHVPLLQGTRAVCWGYPRSFLEWRVSISGSRDAWLDPQSYLSPCSKISLVLLQGVLPQQWVADVFLITVFNILPGNLSS